MSFIGGIFNRKGQLRGVHAPDLKSILFDMEEEDSEEEAEIKEENSPEASPVSQETQETYEILEREIHPAKIICPDCGGITLEGLDFCDKCGGELQ